MSNPYIILKVSQDASKNDIMKAQMMAMKERKYSLQEIQVAVRQLLDPAKRLAADFMYPSKIKAKRPQKILVEIPKERFTVNDIDDNALDSINCAL